MIPSIGGPELIIALVIILLLFGAKRIPELARGLGTGMREFKKGSRGEYDEVDKKREDKKDGEIPAGESEAGSEKPETRLERDASAEADRAEQRRH